MQVILETERLFLRKMTMEDFDSLYVVLADSGIMQHYPYALDEKFPIVPLKYLAIPVCAVATFSAVQEGHYIRTVEKRA